MNRTVSLCCYAVEQSGRLDKPITVVLGFYVYCTLCLFCFSLPISDPCSRYYCLESPLPVNAIIHIELNHIPSQCLRLLYHGRGPYSPLFFSPPFRPQLQGSDFRSLPLFFFSSYRQLILGAVSRNLSCAMLLFFLRIVRGLRSYGWV